MTVTAEDIIQTALEHRGHGYYADLLGLGRRTFPCLPDEQQVSKAAGFVLSYHEMWHCVDNQDPVHQAPEFRGRQPLYLDPDFNDRNPRVTALDYLVVFKEYMRRRAFGRGMESCDAEWFAAQDELALAMP